jgi:hypothetical protein
MKDIIPYADIRGSPQTTCALHFHYAHVTRGRVNRRHPKTRKLVCLVVFSLKKERRRNKDNAGINCGIVLGRECETFRSWRRKVK